MKKILISLLFVLVSAVSANAQLLYRVSGADLKPKSVIRISLCRTAKRNPLIFPI